MKIIVFLLITLITLNANVKRDKKREIVIDFSNKLVWQDAPANLNVILSQPDAMEYCNELIHGGYVDWRIPHGDDYKTIVDKKNKPNNIHRAFRYVVNDGYWAETVHWRTMWTYADYMHFLSGTLYYDTKTKKKRVRCVRDLR